MEPRQGPEGAQGAQGPQGPAAAAAWAEVAQDGTVEHGKNITVQHTGTGRYAVHVSASACPSNTTSAVATAEGVPPQLFVAMVSAGSDDVGVGISAVSGGTSAPADQSFDIQVACN